MRVMTVTCNSTPVAVLRADSVDEAISEARTMAEEGGLGRFDGEPRFAVREPTDGEMIGWLRRREPFLLAHAALAA